jgi:hypothetical protein
VEIDKLESPWLIKLERSIYSINGLVEIDSNVEYHILQIIRINYTTHLRLNKLCHGDSHAVCHLVNYT